MSLFYTAVLIWIGLAFNKIQLAAYQSQDLFFEVLEPQDVKYTYRIKQAKSIGSSFIKSLEHVLLVPVEPFDACEPIQNANKINSNVALVKRGYESKTNLP